MALNETTVVGVVGAGAMGTGIAQIAAAAGHRVILGDAVQDAAAAARANIFKAMEREVAKERYSRNAADELIARIEFQRAPLADDFSLYRDCELVIEAVREDLGTKQALFRRLEAELARDSVLATNTSSLSVTSIASACDAPERVIGLHFFNPAPVMPLVEVIPWLGGNPLLAPQAYLLMQRWQKMPVLASDTPGFIVNRVARPFYGEAIRILEEGVATAPTIDWAMKTFGQFRMGPFELMDFIGNDVNYAVTTSVFEGLFFDPRYRPSLTQHRLVEAGFFGKKSGRGHYDYRGGAPPVEFDPNEAVGRQIFERVLTMLINEAIDAVFMRVASADDVDLAMTKGVNYPKGLLAWGNEIGLPEVLGRIETLQAEYGEDRYRPSPLLRRMVRDNRRFFE